MKMLNILLSAYACEPGKGSEPGVGWHWAVELAVLGHHVTVLTRANNRPLIERNLALEPAPDTLSFVYYDPPKPILWLKKHGLGVYGFYVIWQWGACRLARRLVAGQRFDLVHHITFGSARLPSFMGLLKTPFVFGPVGGGESTPVPLLPSLRWRDRLVENVRTLSNKAIRCNPLMRQTFASAKAILVTTPETQSVLPKVQRRKAKICLSIGVADEFVHDNPIAHVDGELRLLFIGRLLGWKGAHLAIRALARLRQNGVNASLSIVGRGPCLVWLQRLAQGLGVAGAVVWETGWRKREEFITTYRQHDLFLFPSLHDSGGSVVLEAMANGLPVVCLNLGGPGVVVNDRCGRAVECLGCSEDETVARLAAVVAELAASPQSLVVLRSTARSEAKLHSWHNVVEGVYSQIVAALDGEADGKSAI